MIKLFRVTTAAAAIFCAMTTEAATINESVNGEFSNDRGAPTAFNLTSGSNDLFATTQSGDWDIVTVNVPAGNTLSRLFLRSFTQGGFDATAFVGLQSGSTFTVDPNIAGPGPLLGYTHFSPTFLNTDILDDIGTGFDAMGFTPPLASGPYTFFFQQQGTPVSYQLDFVVDPIPEPATITLVGAGLAALVLIARRKARSSHVVCETSVAPPDEASVLS